MKQIIPFKKSITFNNKFETVTSLSLEHDYKVEEGMVKGTFLVTGTTRSTEASLIDEEFSYQIPFEIALSNRVEQETVNITIEDFNYTTSYNDTIILAVNLNLECDEREELFSFIDELSNMDDRIDESDFINVNESFKEENEINIEQEDEIEIENNDIMINQIKDNEIISNKVVNEGLINNIKIEDNSEEEISNNYNNIYSFVSDKEDFVTYKIYFVKENEDYNTIANLFNVSIEELAKYNEIKELQKGDKVIIPYVF